MSGFIVDYSKDVAPPLSDGRLDAPSFHANHRAILTVLQRVIAHRPGDVLEIGSGTGQHLAAFAPLMPDLTWWPSDTNPVHRASIAAWRAHSDCTNLNPPLVLDASGNDWPVGGPGQPPGSDLAAILCINVVHIAPWTVTEGLMRGADRLLAGDGRLILYGPYRRDGLHTAPSNAAFDAALQAQDPRWGVRDTADIARLADANDLGIVETVDMPSNNLCLVVGRRSSRD